jgi:phosphatidylglycerol:prolipoprotein diacylglycerol transferase
MLPILFSIGNIHVYSYGFLISLAFISSFFLIFYLAKKEKLSSNFLFEKLFLIFASSLFFGHLFYFIIYREQFINWYQFFFLWQGMVSFGGILGGGAILYFLFRKNFWSWADIISIGFLLAMAIGRIGCFLVHDHLAIAGPAWLNIQNEVPVALIESILCFIGFGIFYFLKTGYRHSRMDHSGTGLWQLVSSHIFFLVVIYYGLVRIFTDYFRLDLIIFNLKIGQWAGILLVILGIVGIIVLNRDKKIISEVKND